MSYQRNFFKKLIFLILQHSFRHVKKINILTQINGNKKVERDTDTTEIDNFHFHLVNEDKSLSAHN